MYLMGSTAYKTKPMGQNYLSRGYYRAKHRSTKHKREAMSLRGLIHI